MLKPPTDFSEIYHTIDKLNRYIGKNEVRLSPPSLAPPLPAPSLVLHLLSDVRAEVVSSCLVYAESWGRPASGWHVIYL
jgi:hypothetical protein